MQPVAGPVVAQGTLLPPLQQFCTARRASSSPSTEVPPPSASFDGLSSKDSVHNFPTADTSGSAGRFAFGEVINSAIGFFDKTTGRLLCPAQPLAEMWAGTGTPCTDRIGRLPSVSWAGSYRRRRQQVAARNLPDSHPLRPDRSSRRRRRLYRVAVAKEPRQARGLRIRLNPIPPR